MDPFHDFVIARAETTLAAAKMLRALRTAVELGASSRDVDDRLLDAVADLKKCLLSWWPT